MNTSYANRHRFKRGFKLWSYKRIQILNKTAFSMMKNLIIAMIVILLIGGIYSFAEMDLSLGNKHIENPASKLTIPHETESKKEIKYVNFSGRDTDGRVAQFQMWVISADYKWVFGSNSEMNFNGKSNNSLSQHLLSPGMQSKLSASIGIIAVGTASNEGTLLVEEKRAEQRALHILHAVREADHGFRNYFTLNLGKHLYANSITNSSEEQRPVVIISILKADTNINLKSAIEQGMNCCVGGASINLRSYSKFDLKQI